MTSISARTRISARLVEKDMISEDTGCLTFAAIDGELEGCAAGAHIDVHLPGGFIRNYSIVAWELDGSQLTVGVKREDAGRGGSRAMHALAVGSIVEIAGPRNNFPLTSVDEPIVLIGGGIGITPLYAMAKSLRDQNRRFDLYYVARSNQLAAFDKRLRSLQLGDSYHLHCDDTGGLLDLRQLVSDRPTETHYYVCGPEPLLVAAQEATRDLERGTVFFERFAAAGPAESGHDVAFEVVLESSGEEYEVPAGRSILDVLREAGHGVDFACSEGACGTCITDVLEGDIDHRDSILTEEEQGAGDCMCICVSRAASPRLVLDL
jgi:ferredoxin-NADP reductase